VNSRTGTAEVDYEKIKQQNRAIENWTAEMAEEKSRVHDIDQRKISRIYVSYEYRINNMVDD